jgi:hypothetical protein
VLRSRKKTAAGASRGRPGGGSGRLLPAWAYGRHFSLIGRSHHSASRHPLAWNGHSLTVATAHPMARRPQVYLLHNAAVQRLCCCSPPVSRGIGMGMHKLAGPLCPGGVDDGPEVGSRGLESADEGGASGSTWASATRCYPRCPSTTAVRWGGPTERFGLRLLLPGSSLWPPCILPAPNSVSLRAG